MSTILLTLEIRYEQDVVMTRQRMRQIAELLGFDSQDQTRLATAVSEIARNAFQYAKGGKVEFSIEIALPQQFLICIIDNGSGIPDLQAVLNGTYQSATGMGLGIIGTRRLMEVFEIESTPERGTRVLMGKTLPKQAAIFTSERLAQITNELTRRSPQNPYEEIQQQNQELLRALEALRKREEDLIQLNQELEDTNRGVVALYAELDEKADSLKRVNELKTRFLSNMSHEFRTPLNSIISLSRLLLDRTDGDLTSEQEKQVKYIQKSAASLSELVNDLLDLAKVEAGKIDVHPTKFEVSELFATLRGMLRPLLDHNSSISLVIEEPKDFPTLHTDEGKVAQILRNFISNALKYTERGEVRVKAELAGNTIVFAVNDTGIGIAPENFERIFEEFIQVDSPLQRRVKGTGLGLPLSRRLAELLQGSIWVTSTLGVGSTFYASIPRLYPGVTEELPSFPVSWQANPLQIPVLVVEDNPETIFTYEKYFESSIYQLIPARTLEQAKQALKMFSPVVIMLDILLEEQNTWALLSELKENLTTQHIPVFVITVINNEAKALAMGAEAFFVKPVDRLSLLHQINILLKRGKPEKLLLIDDDSAFRYVLNQLVSDCTDRKNLPAHIIEANDGREGIHLAQVEQPDCIILDLAMPELSGAEVLSLLKSDSATSHIPVIIHTSQSLQAEEKKQLAQNTVAILSKETSSSGVAIYRLKEALIKAGLAIVNLGAENV